MVQFANMQTFFLYVLAKIQIYILTRAELLITLCYEIPCMYKKFLTNFFDKLFDDFFDDFFDEFFDEFFDKIFDELFDEIFIF